MQVSGLISPSVKPITESQPQAAARDDDFDFDFDDFLDIINPLQHIPLVGTLYRVVSGDEIEAPAKIAGGALFGGLYGFLSAVGSVVYEGIAGESLEQTILSVFDDVTESPLAVAHKSYQSAQMLQSEDIERSSLRIDSI